MGDDLLSLQISEHARIAHSSLRPEDRRIVDAWFDHLRNWRNDEFVRSKSKRLDSAEEDYVIKTSTDLFVAFRITESQVVVLSIFREEALRMFETATGRTAR